MIVTVAILGFTAGLLPGLWAGLWLANKWMRSARKWRELAERSIKTCDEWIERYEVADKQRSQAMGLLTPFIEGKPHRLYTH